MHSKTQNKENIFNDFFCQLKIWVHEFSILDFLFEKQGSRDEGKTNAYNS